MRDSPNSLPPQLLDQHNRPHGLSSTLIVRLITLALSLHSGTLDISTHSSLNHPEEESLDHSVELVVLRLRVGRSNVGEDRFSDGGSEDGGSEDGKEGKEGSEESTEATGSEKEGCGGGEGREV